MSIYIINGGIFNTSTTCIIYSRDYVESIFECINKYYGSYKLALKKSEGLVSLIKNDITMYKLDGSVNDTDFKNVMNKVFESYFTISGFEDKTFEANGREEIFGFKRIEGVDCWFVSKSAACIKKIITQMIKDNELQKGTFKKYPFTVKPKKPIAKSSIQIQNSDDEEEKPKAEKPKRIVKKTVKPKKEEKKEEVKDEESDEDNGIQKPEPKVEVKTSTSKSSRSERSEKDKKVSKKPSRSPSVKLEKSKSKTKTKSSSSSSIREEEIEKPQKANIKVEKIVEKSGSSSDSENSNDEIPEENNEWVNGQIDNIETSQSDEETQEDNSNSDSDKSEGESVMSSEEDDN